MNDPIMITIYTQVYNTKPYIRQCVESVLNQTYPHFEYYLIDNGSTDGCKEILEEYAASDRRIRLIRYEKNALPCPGAEVAITNAAGRYYSVLDSDDWIEPDFFEKLLAFAEEERLDIACTGAVMHYIDSGKCSLRKMEQRMILSRQSFAEGFPLYHVFFRTTWGKLVRTEYFQAATKNPGPDLYYGEDTKWSFLLLRNAGRIGIDTSTFYHYRIFNRSLSYRYDPARFDSDIYLYNDAIDFLSAFGPVSAYNRLFLQVVYSNALGDTARVIQHSALSPADKLREYRTIASHPLTLATYRECTDESASRSKTGLIVKTLEAGRDLGESDDSDLRAVMQTLLPQCGSVVSAENARMFLKDPLLLRALVQDDSQGMLENFLERIRNNREVKKYAVPEAIRVLAANNPLLCQINETVFLRKYGDLYQMIWQEKTLDALDQMTGLLLEDQVSSGRETFLQLYISLSALLEQAPAFIFGKLQLARLFLRQNRLQECQNIVKEFEDMGMSDDEDINDLRHALQIRS